MTDQDGQPVTAADYRHDLVLLYFGYTECPDECPTTLTMLANALHTLGPQASQVRVLFVTVDPSRDTTGVLKRYVSNFGPEFVGLRPDQDELTALSKRYRISYHYEKPDKARQLRGRPQQRGIHLRSRRPRAPARPLRQHVTAGSLRPAPPARNRLTAETAPMRFLATLVVLLLVSPAPVLSAAADARLASPVGLWQPLDSSGKPLGLIRIYEVNGLYYGRIEPMSPTRGPQRQVHTLHRRPPRQADHRPRAAASPAAREWQVCRRRHPRS